MPNRPWETREPQPLTTANLRALLDNEIPAIRLPAFCSAAECAAFERAIDKAIEQKAMSYYSFQPPLGFIGMTQFEYRHKPKAAYFADAPESYRKQRIVLDRSFDAVERIIAQLRAVYPGNVAIAQEPEMSAAGRYFAGNIRDSSHGASLHADFAPYSAPNYLIANVQKQLSWNLFVSMPEMGGRTLLWNKFWQADVAPGGVSENKPGSFAMDQVEGVESYAYQPLEGEAVIFNSRNLHTFEGGKDNSTRRRLQINAFIGLIPSGDLVLWS